MWLRPLPRRRPLQTCTPRTSPMSAIRFRDALPSREDGLPASSEFSEVQLQDWELSIYLGRERSATPANVTVKVTGLKPSS